MIVLVGFIVSIAFAILCYLSTENLISTIGVSSVTFLYFAIYVYKKIKTKNVKINRFHECYQFINNFLISLSIKGNLSGALASALETQAEDTVEALKELATPDPMSKLDYLKRIFSFDAYYLFLDLLKLYDEQGGNILKMSHYLTNQIREDEDYLVNIERQHKDAIIEFSVLWCFSLLIMGVLKFSLSDFYSHIVSNQFYQISIVAIFLFVLITIHIAVGKITNIEINGWTKDE